MTSTSASWTGYLRIIALVSAILLVAGCSSASDPKDEQSAASTSEATDAVADPISGGAAICEEATSVARSPLAESSPTEYLPKQMYTLKLVTNCGEIEIQADGIKAPATVSTIGFLANSGYYDATLCHRLTTSGIFVLQCGDPQGDGGGTPGFTFVDENLPTTTGMNYPKGTVAMANSGPNTNGSQFFLVYADTTLGPNYSVWGTITKGLDIVEKVAALGTSSGGPDGSPLQSVEIRSARLS